MEVKNNKDECYKAVRISLRKGGSNSFINLSGYKNIITKNGNEKCRKKTKKELTLILGDDIIVFADTLRGEVKQQQNIDN